MSGVELTHERWHHIIGCRPALAELKDEILATVAAPDEHTLDPEEGRELYWRLRPGRSWLRVIVDFTGRDPRVVEGELVTATPDRRGPPDASERRRK